VTVEFDNSDVELNVGETFDVHPYVHDFGNGLSVKVSSAARLAVSVCETEDGVALGTVVVATEYGGLFVAIDATALRNLAANILRAADMIDGRAGVQ
jgi:hypothetical protein